jgi:hypothetical protein
VTALRPEVPAALAAVVSRLLAKRPEERFQSPAELAAALEAFARGTGLPTGAWRRPARRWLAGVAAVLLVAGLGLLGWRLVTGQERPDDGPQAPTADSRAAALATIHNWGGKVHFLEGQPDRLVESVDLLGVKVRDDDLAQLRAFPELRRLDLDSPELTDDGLRHIESLTEMRWLLLQDTRIGDRGLARLKGMTRLVWLWLYGASKVTDAGLKHLEDKKELVSLALWGTQVRGPGLASLVGLPQLANLSLHGSWNRIAPIDDEGAAHLAALTRLRSLELKHTKVGDRGLKHLRNLSELRTLILDGTLVGDEGIRWLKDLTRLEELSLVGARVSDGGLKSLAGLAALQRLNLTGTQVRGAGLKHLEGLTRLQTLVLPKTVSAEAVKGLQAALPKTRIVRE